MLPSVKHVPLFALLLLSMNQVAQAVNPAHWMIVEQLNRSDSSKTWISPTPIDLGKMLWQYDYEITKVTGTVNLGIFGDYTEDITSSIPADDRIGSGDTRNLPAVLLDAMIVDPATETSADVLVEIQDSGFGRAVFSNIMLGSVDVPLIGNRPIQRINIEASVDIVGYDFGDYSHDRRVDAADYVVWRDMDGQSWAGLAADGNGDDQINAADYDVWRAHFGTPAGGDGALVTLAVPEPANLAAFLVGLLAILFRRRMAAAKRCIANRVFV